MRSLYSSSSDSHSALRMIKLIPRAVHSESFHRKSSFKLTCSHSRGSSSQQTSKALPSSNNSLRRRCCNGTNKSSIEIIQFVRHLLSSRKLKNNKYFAYRLASHCLCQNISIVVLLSSALSWATRQREEEANKMFIAAGAAFFFLFTESHDGSSIKCLMKIIASEWRRWYLLATTIEDEQHKMDRITVSEGEARIMM